MEDREIKAPEDEAAEPAGVLAEDAHQVTPPEDIPETAADTTGESPSEAAARTDAELPSGTIEEVEPATEAVCLESAEGEQTPLQDATQEENPDTDVSAELLAQQLGLDEQEKASADESEEAARLAILEAIVYVTDEPLTAQQIASALQQPVPEVRRLLDKLTDEYNKPHHGLTVKEVAGGYKMATKAEHHEAVRAFVKNLNPPLKLSLAALETLAVIAYKQPITAPEIMEVRGVQGAGVLKTLLDRKLITSAGRKNVVGKPILYKTTKEFLVQFGLKDLAELPSLKEFEELRRLAFSDTEDGLSPELVPVVEPGEESAEHIDSGEPESIVDAGELSDAETEQKSNE